MSEPIAASNNTTPSLFSSAHSFKSYFAIGIAAFLGACGAESLTASPNREDRCDKDGFCFEEVAKKSLKGAFRNGAEEIKFDAVYRPDPKLVHLPSEPWCVRLSDQTGKVFSTVDNSHCPETWSAPRANNVAQLAEETKVAHRKRDALIQSAVEHLEEAQVPDARQDAWKNVVSLLKEHVEDVKKPLVVGRDVAVIEPAAKTNDKAQGVDAPEPFPAVYSQTGIAKAHAQLVHESFDEETSPAGTVAPFSGRHPNDPPRTSPAELVIQPQLEFKQTISLFSQPTKSMLAFGSGTKKHHTAAKIWVYSRPRGSSEPFTLFNKTRTANHGAGPDAPAMINYATCDDTPITVGSFIWKGECSGSWGLGRNKHLCNDDTRMQILNAYGEGGIGKKCEKIDSYHRPWCHKRGRNDPG